MSTIRYFLPEDGDREDTPNVFLSPKPSQPGYPPLLGQIKGSFPLPGRYHFRFKAALVPGTDRDKDAVALWMDCSDDADPVPVWQNTIFAKVTRIGMDEEYVSSPAAAPAVAPVPIKAPRAVVTRTESNASSTAPSVQPSAPKLTHHQTNLHDSLLGGFDDPPAPAPAASTSGNLLDVDHHHHHPTIASGGSLLDIPTGVDAHTPTASDHDELLNMSAPMQSAQSQPPVQKQPMQPQPMQQQPMQGQYGHPQGQYGVQGMAQMPPPQQQQLNASTKSNVFDNFSDPLNGLNWS